MPNAPSRIALRTTARMVSSCGGVGGAFALAHRVGAHGGGAEVGADVDGVAVRSIASSQAPKPCVPRKCRHEQDLN